MVARKDKETDSFKWTDDEAELLLSVTHDYKVKKIAENVDWESVKTKYEDILVLMRQELPETMEEARDTWSKDYRHTRMQITKKILTAKLKAIRIKFREAVDSGRRSGHGRVVLLYYELCEKIWGGSPATEEIESGFESTDIILEDTDDRALSVSNETDQNDLSSNDTDDASDTTAKRRELLDKKLSTYKHERMKRKLPVDTQLLSCAKEELALKRKMVEQLHTFEKQYSQTMTKITCNMDKLANSISDGFTVLKHLMAPQPPAAPYYQAHQFPQMYSHQPSGNYTFPQAFNPDSP